MSDHVIPDDHMEVLRTLFKLGEADELPPEVESEYWRLKRVFDRVSCRVTINELALLAWKLDAGTESYAVNVAELARKKVIAYGERVEALFRKEWRPGKLIGPAGRTDLIVQLDGDSEERKFDGAKVRIESKEPVTA